jgi:hypothetical protein
MRVVALLALCAALAACSSQPTTPQAESVPADVPPAPVVTESVLADPVPESAAAPVDTAAVAKPAVKIPSGYRRETRNGKEFFCRNETTLGSRFAQKTCLSREQIEKLQSQSDSTMDNLEQGMKVCGGGSSCSNGG